MNTRAERWLSTDETDDVAGSVRHCIDTYPLVVTDEQSWKWVALSLHSAVQGACICHLTTTAVPIGVVYPDNAAEWCKFFEESRDDPSIKAPRTRLMNLPELLKAARLSQSAGDRSNNEGIQLSDDELAWLRRFHEEIRNQFTHFSPRGWSIEISGIPSLTILGIRIIREIRQFGWAFRHRDAAWLTDFDDCLCRLEHAAREIEF